MAYSTQAVRDMLAPYIADPDALAVGTSLLNAVLSTEQVMQGRADSGVSSAVAAMLVDFAFALGQNPFWQKWNAYLVPVFASAIMARLDSYAHAAGRPTDEDRLAFLTAHHQVVEIAVAVLYCTGGVDVRSGASVKMRADLLVKLRALA